MQRLTIVVLAALTIGGSIAAQDLPASDSLEAQLAATEQSWQQANTAARKIAFTYREASTAEMPDEQVVQTLKSDLESAVTKAFQAQIELQQIRLQLAEENLQRVKTKLQRRENLASSIIARRVGRLQAGLDVSETDGTPSLRPFISPEALFAEWNRCCVLRDFRGIVSLMDDTAVAELAGHLLPNISFIAEYGLEGHPKGLAEQFSALARQYRHNNPTAQAQAAEAIVFQRLFLGERSGEADVSTKMTDTFRERLVTVAENLTDPRGFCADYITLGVSDIPPDTDIFPWDISIIDETAIAVPPESHPLSWGAFEAQRIESGWIIHSVFSSLETATRTPVTELPEEHDAPTEPVEQQRLIRHSESPQRLMVEWNRCGREKDYAGMTSLMDENAVTEFAGIMLFSAAAMSSVVQLIQATGQADTNPETVAMKSIHATVERHRRSDTPPKALVAYTQLSQQSIVMMVQSQHPPAAPTVSPQVLRTQMIDAAGILTDPRAFILEIAPAFEVMNEDSETDTSEEQTWTVVTDGDRATATSSSGKTKTVYQLRRHDSGWIIHSMLSEESVANMFPTFSSTPSISSDLAMPSNPPSSLHIATEPVPLSFTTLQPIAAGDRITWDNVAVVGGLGGDPDLGVLLPKGHPFRDSRLRKHIGKHATVSLEPGNVITAEQMVSPTPQQLVSLKLSSVSTQPLIADWSDKSQFAFHHSGIEYHRERLPDWATDYISEINQQLTAANGKWTPEVLSTIASLDSLIHVWQEDDDWDLDETGKLLDDWAYSNAASDDPTINEYLLSAEFLSRLARTHGRIPVSVFDAKPLSASAVRKLQLLREMLKNNADERWIGQEQVRLAGLLDAAPAQAIRLLLSAGKIKDHYAMERWIHALSSVEIYGEFNASPQERYVQPIDPVLMIAILSARVGESRMIGTNISCVLREEHPANMLNMPLNNILSGTSGYREHVYKALATMYRKSQSEDLTSAISNVAPGVVVRAKEPQSAD